MSIVAQSRELLRSALRRAANGLLPATCLLCGDACRQGLLCAPCRDDLPRLGPQVCSRCAAPDCGGLPCPQCQRQPPHFDATWAVWRYAYPLDTLVGALKYRGELGLAPFFADALAQCLAPHAEQWDGLLPLPLHPQRLRTRGFNQSLEIGRHLARAINLPLLDGVCERIRETRPQTELPLEKRQSNVRGAFHCRRELSGQRLLLLDDVLTTGATLSECARILKLHGAASIHVAVLARTPPHP